MPLHRKPPYSYRDDPAVPAFPDDRRLIVFDGDCVLCSGWADFVIRHDPGMRFRLAAAQSPLGQALYRHYGVMQDGDYASNLLLEDGRLYTKSRGTLRMLAGLGFPWSLAVALRIVPERLLDWLYDIVARRRLGWFGRRSACYRPTPADEGRFLS